MRRAWFLMLLVAPALAGCASSVDPGGPRSAMAGMSLHSGDVEGEPERLLWIRGYEAPPDAASDGLATSWAYGLHDPVKQALYEHYAAWDDGRRFDYHPEGLAVVHWDALDVENLLDSTEIQRMVPRPAEAWAAGGWYERHYWLSVEDGRPVWQVSDHVVADEGNFERRVSRIDAVTGERIEWSPENTGLQAAIDLAQDALADVAGTFVPVEARYVERDDVWVVPWGRHSKPLAIPDIAWRDGHATSWSLRFYDAKSGLMAHVDVRWDGSLVVPAPEFVGLDLGFPSDPDIGQAPFQDHVPGPQVLASIGYRYSLEWHDDRYYIFGGSFNDDAGGPRLESQEWHDW